MDTALNFPFPSGEILKGNGKGSRPAEQSGKIDGAINGDPGASVGHWLPSLTTLDAFLNQDILFVYEFIYSIFCTSRLNYTLQRGVQRYKLPTVTLNPYHQANYVFLKRQRYILEDIYS